MSLNLDMLAFRLIQGSTPTKLQPGDVISYQKDDALLGITRNGEPLRWEKGGDKTDDKQMIFGENHRLSYVAIAFLISCIVATNGLTIERAWESESFAYFQVQ